MNPPPLAHRDAALTVEFDGTLVDLAPTPAALTVHPELPMLLARPRSLLDSGVAVKVSTGATLAGHWMADPAAVRRWLSSSVAQLSTTKRGAAR